MKRTHVCLVMVLATAFRTLEAGAGPKPGDVFRSPMQNFEITVPKFPDGTKVQEHHDAIHGHVTFAGGSGDLNRIAYQRFDSPPPSTIGADSVLSLGRTVLSRLDSLGRASLVTSTGGLDAAARSELLARIDRWLPGVNISVPGGGTVPESSFVGLAALGFMQLSSVQDQLMAGVQGRPVSREAVVRDSTLMILTIVVSPEGSATVDMASGKHFDEISGNLVFVRNGYLYNLRAMPNGYATGMAATRPNPQDELAGNARRLVMGLYSNISFH